MLTPTTTIVDGGSFTRAASRFRTPGAPPTGRSSCPQALQVSSDVFFYNVGADLYSHGNDAQQKWASELGIGHPTGIDLPGEVRRAAADAGVAQPALLKPRATDRDRPAVDRWATTSTSRSARETCRPTRSRWRSPTRRSPTAATSSGPTSGMEVEDASGRAVQEIDPAPQRHLDIDPAVPAGDPRGHPHGRAVAGRDLVLGVRQLPDPDGRQDGDRAAHRPGGPVLVRGAGALSQPARSSSRRRSSRAGFGVEAAAPVAARSSTPTTTPTSRRPRRPEARSPSRARFRRARPRAAPRGTPTDGLRRLSPPLRRAPRGRRRRARRRPRPRPAAPARRPRADRLRPLHAGRGDGRRHPARPLLLRHPPGDLRGDRASP